MNKIPLIGFLAAASLPLLAQQPQIPTLQVCNLTGGMAVSSAGVPQVHIPSRVPGGFTGSVDVKVGATCDANGFPAGAVTLSALSMNDSLAEGVISSVRIDQITSTGTVNPTAYLSGLCLAQIGSAAGTVTRIPCHFWILFAHAGSPNEPTSVGGVGVDTVSFLVFDKTGKRIAYGTGQVTAGSGSIQVTPTSN